MKCITCTSEIIIRKYDENVLNIHHNVSYTQYICKSIFLKTCNNNIIYDNTFNRLEYYRIRLSIDNINYILCSDRGLDLNIHTTLFHTNEKLHNKNIIKIKKFIEPNNIFKLKDYKDIAEKLLNLNIFS